MNIGYSPHDLLPSKLPSSERPEEGYFYHKVAKHLITDVVRIMDNGLSVDLNKVIKLEEELDNILEDVDKRLDKNPLIQKYLDKVYGDQIEDYIQSRKNKLKTKEDYLVEFKPSNALHRSYFMDEFSRRNDISLPSEKYPSGASKWSFKLVKRLSSTYPLLKRLVDKTISSTHPIAIKAMENLAEDKASMYNEKYLKQIKYPDIPKPKFNPASSKQKQELFEMLGIEPEKRSKKTGKGSFDRDEMEKISKTTTNPDIKDLVDAILDYSMSAIIRNNFIKAFYNYTVNGRLYGTLTLFGAKSFRLTSKNPNLLNMPSTGSPFAKPVKRCFTAPEGKVIATIDFSALEDRVVASLSRDPNKCSIFTEGLDGHSLSATYYFPDRVKAIIGDFTDNKEAAKLLKEKVDEGIVEAKEVRQDSKPVSFGLAYGAFPKKVSESIKCSLEEAENIFNAYHYQLFPKISEYREDYVLPTAIKEGRLHLGLGCYIYTDDPEKDIRTLSNASIQFWSILTLLSINKLHKLIDSKGWKDKIQVISTIYDSIYFEVDRDPEVIKWLNDVIVDLMTTDFIEGQVVKNEAELEIGPDWATLYKVPNKASIEVVKEVLNEV